MSGEEEVTAPGECGECLVCCEWLDIETEGLSKKSGSLCVHCVAKGCGIYETRPMLCRNFYCGWRLVAKLGPEWRPDRSGVMILVVDKVPAEFSGSPTGFNFVVLGGEAAIRRPGFAEYLSLLVSRNVAVYLSADSPKTLINQYLLPLVNDLPGTIQMLLHIFSLHLEQRKSDPDSKPLPFQRGAGQV